MNRIDFKKITQQADDDIRRQTMAEEVKRCYGELLVTDILANKDKGGIHILEYLENKRYQQNVKVFVRYNRWGEQVFPGDVIKWKSDKQYKDDWGKKFDQFQLNDMAMNNTLKDLDIYKEAVIDEKGCVDVSFQDALILLSLRGVHFESGMRLCKHKEVASYPSRARKRFEGESWESYERNVPGRIQRFWLYQEVPEEAYNNLPVLPSREEIEEDTSESSKKKPGRPRKNKE